MSGIIASLITSPDQVQLADSVARFVRERYAHRDWQQIVDGESGICEERWRAMAELGWLGLGLPEACGGYGGSLQDALVVIEALGAGLAAEPLASTVLVCGDLIATAASAEAAQRIVPRIVAGELRLAFAHDEDDDGGDAAEPAHGALRAQAAGDGWRLDGEKRRVLDAPHAGALVVSARVSGGRGDADGLALFLVPVDAPGVSLKTVRTFDRRRIADVVLRGVALDGQAMIGTQDTALPAIRRALDRRIAVLAAEASGLAAVAVDTTRDYLSTRLQFGQALASFQALQHRLVDMYIACEEIRTAARIAAIACEAGESAGTLISAAKVKVSRAGQRVGREAIQLHGGMGMTDEMAIGDCMKRLEAIALLAGGVDGHLDRCAARGPLIG
ncbi:MAG: acyl-CoA dehydrogenase family protein [Burkholderiaceae bacterium]